jgi:signal transduction histidine kinase
MKYVYILSVSLMLLLCEFAHAQTPKLIIDGKMDVYQLNTCLRLLKDSTQKITLYELMTTPLLQFEPLNGKVYQLHQDKNTTVHWLCLEVENRSQDNLFYLSFLPRLDSITFYYQQEDGKWGCSTKGLKKSNELDNFNFSITKSIYLKRGESKLYFRISGNSLLHRERGLIYGYLRNSEEFQKNNSFENFIFGLVFGILPFIFLYNLWIYGLTQKPLYGIFLISCFIDILFIYHLAKPNFMWAYFGVPFWTFYLYHPLSLLIVVTRAWFTQHFLETKRYAPWGNKMLFVIKIVALFSLIFMPLGYFNVGVNVSYCLFFLLPIVSVATTIYRIRQGFKGASYFLLTSAISLFTVFFIVWRMIMVHYIDSATWIIAPIAEVFYFVILSRALAGQINDLRKEIEEKSSNLKSEKERISRDLHDNIGSQLTYLSRSLERIKENQAKGQIDEISEYIKNIISDLRSTIWVLNKESMSIKDFETKVLVLLWQMKSQLENTEFSLEKKGADNAYLTSSQAINLYRIVQEALHNSIKYSNASLVKVEINTHEFVSPPFTFCVRIMDNGKGFDINTLPALGKSHFGIQNMEQRAGEIGGRLVIQTAKGEGTIVEVLL